MEQQSLNEERKKQYAVAVVHLYLSPERFEWHSAELQTFSPLIWNLASLLSLVSVGRPSLRQVHIIVPLKQ